jgi:3-hydroxyacyl-CoA dehydrogenase/enoyl-CoA hydratase/3-hydroxybutyryl-CoA epimerase
LKSARCYEEGVLRNVPDANIGSIFGIGLAPWTGGQLQYINFIGVNEFVPRSNELAAKHGERFTPPKLLRRHGCQGRDLRIRLRV